nr:carbohydrate-binding domain-containing protein [Bacteroidaceae bacterium]
MKFYKILFLLSVLMIGSSYETEAQNIYICKDGKYTVKSIVDGLEIDLTSDCDSITFSQPASLTEETFNDTIYVTYNGTSAKVSTLPSDGTIIATVTGADVTIVNSITDREITTVLSGLSTSGSFVYSGSYKTTVRLNGLTLTGSTAEAINIQDGKRIALELAEGTVNTLSDCITDNDQKAAFYTKGHLEISGAGTLNLIGNAKHGISTKEYLLVKKTAGSITVNSAAKDGIHAGQYFKMNGGTITVTGVKGDAIQAEATGDS